MKAQNFFKILLLSLITFGVFIFAGGDAKILWQPYIIMMLVGFHVTFLLFTDSRFRAPKNSDEVRQFKNAGKSAMIISAVVPTLLGIIHTLGLHNYGAEMVGLSLGASLVAPVYAVIVYFSVFSDFEPIKAAR